MAVVASVPAGSIDTSLGDPNTDYTTFSVELWLDANGPKVEVAQGAMLIGLMLGCLCVPSGRIDLSSAAGTDDHGAFCAVGTYPPLQLLRPHVGQGSLLLPREQSRWRLG